MDRELKQLQLNVSQLAALSGVHRQTVSARLKNVRPSGGNDSNLKLYGLTDILAELMQERMMNTEIEGNTISFYNIQNIAFADETGSVISCWLSINDVNSPLVPFNAMSDDVEPYGRELFNDLNDGEFGSVAEYVPPQITPEQAADERKRLQDEALASIAPLQDAVDLDIATDGESALLLAWKKYRVMLNRVDVSTAPDIEWPKVPS